MAQSRYLGPYSGRMASPRVYPLPDDYNLQVLGLPVDAVDGPGNTITRPYYPEHWPFVAAGITQPDYFWTCQEASGNLLDIANMPQASLTAGANVLYQQSVTGWTSKFVGIGAVGGNSGFYSGIGTLWNVASQSVFALMYSAAVLSDGNRVMFLGGGTSPQAQIQIVAAGQAASFLSTSTVGTFVYESASPVVYPFAWHYDRRGSGYAGLYTNKEALVSTWANLSDSNKGFGGPIASPQARHNMLAVWVGTKAEQMFDRGGANLGGKTLIANLGWPMSY